ncbi:restriction endonuclease [Streptomyces sp. NPDC090493]|uniref:restriction endonuclease n=1 Tax=Streptomyces sp. NPDC090493 TaxID=3365964 RepID=UPI003807C3AF
MFEEDGSLDPLLKFLLYAVIALTVGKMLWKWLTEDVLRWITVDLWRLAAGHQWWTALTTVGGLMLFLLLAGLLSGLSGAGAYRHVDEAETADEPDVLTFKMKQLASMSASGFEQACADLLARDGFRQPRRVGGAGDLGADVTAWDGDDRPVILQCKQYASPVGSGPRAAVQRNSPHHGADVPILIALNGFTQPATDFARRHALLLVSRRELKLWAHGRHLYDVLGIESAA